MGSSWNTRPWATTRTACTLVGNWTSWWNLPRSWRSKSSSAWTTSTHWKSTRVLGSTSGIGSTITSRARSKPPTKATATTQHSDLKNPLTSCATQRPNGGTRTACATTTRGGATARPSARLNWSARSTASTKPSKAPTTATTPNCSAPLACGNKKWPATSRTSWATPGICWA